MVCTRVSSLGIYAFYYKIGGIDNIFKLDLQTH